MEGRWCEDESICSLVCYIIPLGGYIIHTFRCLEGDFSSD